MLVVVGREATVGYVHPGEPTVHLVAARVEPPVDVLPVSLGKSHRRFTRRGRPPAPELRQVLEQPLLLRLDRVPIFTRIRLRAAGGDAVRVGRAPPLFHLLLVLGRIELAQPLEHLTLAHLLLTFQGAQRRFDSTQHPHQALDALLQHRLLLGQRSLSIVRRIVEGPPDALQRHSQLAQQQDLVQALQVFGGVEPISGIAPSRGDQQPELVVMMERSYRHTCQSGDVAHGVVLAIHGVKLQPHVT